jgi:hypothetical protein
VASYNKRGTLYIENQTIMSRLTLPRSPDDLSDRLRTLHAKRKNEKKLLLRSPRQRTSRREREAVLRKTNGCCHLCGGQITENKFAVGHVVAHAAGGQSLSDNYLAVHGTCNGSRWDYSPEEIQWILKMGVWARKQMEAKTPIGVKMVELFYQREKATEERRRVRAAKALLRQRPPLAR